MHLSYMQRRLLAPLLFVGTFFVSASPGQSPHARLRGDYANCRHTFESTHQGNVAFLGGSITEMNGYRPMVMEFLQKRFPMTKFEFTNAGIASTCSHTGAFRLRRDVLAAKPDLVFVEFAVNDDQDAAHSAEDCVRGMEGILRQIRMANPRTDIVVTHFVNPPMLAVKQAGKTPISSGRHELVAEQYGVSTCDVVGELADRIERGEMTWKRYGGTHPKPPGNRVAADLIEQVLTTAWEQNNAAADHPLPECIDETSFFRGRFLDISRASQDAGWEIKVPEWKEIPGSFRSRFADHDFLCGTQAGAELSLPFSGTAVGIYLLAGPDAGTVEFSIDGGSFQTVDLFHRFSKGLHYPRTVVLASGLGDSQHQLRLRIAKTKNDQSTGHAVRIMEFAVN